MIKVSISLVILKMPRKLLLRWAQ